MKVRITGHRYIRDGALKLGEIVTIKERDGYYNAFAENRLYWMGNYIYLDFEDVVQQLNERYELEEVKEVFEIKDLRSGMVVECKGNTGLITKDLIVEFNGKIKGLSLDGTTYSTYPENYHEGTKILRVWSIKVSPFNHIGEELNDDCLIYEAKTEMKQEINKLKKEIEEFYNEVCVRLHKIEELED